MIFQVEFVILQLGGDLQLDSQLGGDFAMWFAAAKMEFQLAKWHTCACRWFLSSFRSCKMSCETHLWHTSSISQPMPPSSQLRTTLRNHLQAANEFVNHLQVVKSPISCKTKVQTCKMDNSTCESPCEMHPCKLKYL